ncbi:MAG: hypothetical protein ACRCZB_03490 [Bacteroidales bacterium]
MNANSTTIYKLHFNSKEEKDYYFSSLAAIYEHFSADDIGCKVGNLWRHKIVEGKPYKNKKCTISKETVRRKAQNN